jgi:hypothetical protein
MSDNTLLGFDHLTANEHFTARISVIRGADSDTPMVVRSYEFKRMSVLRTVEAVDLGSGLTVLFVWSKRHECWTVNRETCRVEIFAPAALRSRRSPSPGVPGRQDAAHSLGMSDANLPDFDHLAANEHFTARLSYIDQSDPERRTFTRDFEFERLSMFRTVSVVDLETGKPTLFVWSERNGCWTVNRESVRVEIVQTSVSHGG